MGMTNKQFQGFVRLTIDKIKRALKESPDNQELIDRLLALNDNPDEFL